jgi:hypothetical protein
VGPRAGLDVVETETSLDIAGIRTSARRLNNGKLLRERHNYKADATVQKFTILHVTHITSRLRKFVCEFIKILTLGLLMLYF